MGINPCPCCSRSLSGVSSKTAAKITVTEWGTATYFHFRFPKFAGILLNFPIDCVTSNNRAMFSLRQTGRMHNRISDHFYSLTIIVREIQFSKHGFFLSTFSLLAQKHLTSVTNHSISPKIWHNIT